MTLFKKSIIFFIVFAVVANLSGNIIFDFKKKSESSMRVKFLITQTKAEEKEPRQASEDKSPGKQEGAAAKGASSGAAAKGAGSVCAAIVTIVGGGTSAVTGWTSNPICQAIQIAWEAVRFVADAAWKASEKIGKTLRDIIAKRIMDYIVDQTVKWIQGGGKPKFITNWNGFMKDVGDIAFDSVAKELGLANLCSPFGLQLKLAFLPVPKLSQRINCSLDQFVKNIENFYVDFSVGGWEGYLLSLEPNNNFYGVMMLAHDEAVKRQAEQKENAKSESIASKGFLGVKQCKKGTEKNIDGEIASINKIQGEEMTSLNMANCAESLGPEPDSKNKEEFEEYYKKLDKCVKDESAKDLGYTKDTAGDYCAPKDMVNVTPGDIVGKAVGNAVTSDTQWAANIQSWTSALVNALINRLMKEGLSMLKDSDSYTSPSRYYPPEYSQLANQQAQQDKRDTTSQINPIKNEWYSLLTAKSNSLVYAREVLTTLRELQANNCTSTTGQLVTAADIASASSTVDSIAAEVADLETKIQEAESVIDQINSAQTDAGKTAANFAFNNFMNTYNTVATQTQIADGSARASAQQQETDLRKQLEGEEVLVNNIAVNNGLRQRLSECRGPSVTPGGSTP